MVVTELELVGTGVTYELRSLDLTAEKAEKSNVGEVSRSFFLALLVVLP
jgi:hypothetical protein